MLRRKILAAVTTLALALGMSVGGAGAAFANHGGPNGTPPTAIPGVTLTDDNGLTCDKAGYTKPGAMDKSSGTHTEPWGTATWNGSTFSWTLNDGWDVDFCVKGSTWVSEVDTSAFTGTTYDFKGQVGHGISHTGFRIVSQPTFDPNWTYAAPTCDGITIAFPSTLPKGQQGVIEVNVEFSFGTLQYKLEGNDYAAAYPNGHAGKTVVLTWDQFRNGTVPETGTWSIAWVQVHGTNYHWKGEINCGSTPPPPECVTVVWEMPRWAGSQTPTWPQKFYAAYETECYNLDVFVPADCGTYWQVDSYLNNATTAALIKGGVLNGPNNPKESFPPNPGWGKTYKLVKNADCEPPKLNLTFMCKTVVDGPVTNLAYAGNTESFPAGSYIFRVTSDVAGVDFQVKKAGTLVYEGTTVLGDTFFVLTEPIAGLTIFWNGGSKGTSSTNEKACGFIPVVTTAEIDITPADCLNGSSLNEAGFLFTEGESSYVITDGENGEKIVTFTAALGFTFAEGKSTLVFPFTPTGPDLDDCGLATAAIDVSPADCFSGTSLNEDGFEFDPARASYEITTAESGVQTVTFTAKPGFLFEGQKQTVSFEFTPSEPDFSLCDEATASVVIPGPTCDDRQFWSDRIVTTDNASIQSVKNPTLLNGGAWSITFVAETGAKFFVDGAYVDTFTVSGKLEPRNAELCLEASASIAFTEPTCDTGAALDRDSFQSTGPVTFTVIADGTGIVPGAYMVIATVDEGYRFDNGTRVQMFMGKLDGPDQSLCIDPEFGAALALTPECEVDVPWITVEFEVVDPDGQLTPGQARVQFEELTLGLTEEVLVVELQRFDGTEWVSVPGNIVTEAGVYQGRALWPGASVDAEGNPTGWPGWEFNAVDGWFATDYEVNAAWTRSVGVDGADPIEVRVVINPSAVIEDPFFTYPPATEDCSTDPIQVTPLIEVSYDCFSFGTITLSDTDGVIWSINGEEVEPGEYSGFDLDSTPRVTAVTDPERPGLFFAPESITDLTVEFSEPEFPCDLTTLPLVEPNVTTTQATCDASGSYTLSKTEGVQWVVGGQNVNPGTYTAAPGSTVSVEAVALDGFGFGVETQTEWELEFAAAPTNCTDLDLPTLALTGASGMLGTVGILALLITLTGIGVVATRRRVEV